MYNLLVSAHEDAWDGEFWRVEPERCVREYTDEDITQKFGDLDAPAVAELKRLPCIFAYEARYSKAPHFGVLRDVTKRPGEMKIKYELQAIDPFLSANDLSAMSLPLDIRKWELDRTHWAVKNINLFKVLQTKGIILPAWTQNVTKVVDISTHSFEVALSFPGEVRSLVQQIALELERRIGSNSYFYDNNYASQLARPSLDTLLQDIYRNRSKLVVVFLSGDYQRKDWCGIEFRAIKEIIMERDHKRVMFIRTDDGSVDGVFRTDGYVDARRFNATELAGFIHDRAILAV
jgi:hypothetical protein